MLSRTKLFTLFLALLTLVSCSQQKTEPVFKLNSALTQRGKELVVGIAACGFCHGAVAKPSAVLSGGRGFYDKHGEVLASNITPDRSTGIGSWSASEFISTLRSGLTPTNRSLSVEVHYGYAWMADQDLLAILNYLRSLPAVSNEVDQRKLSFLQRNFTGFLESRQKIEGYIPAIETRWVEEYGKYLVDHVAQCGSCHHAEGGMFSNAGYLEGGRTIKFNTKEKIAPNITASKVTGIGSWGEAGLLQYFKKGVTPDNHFVDANFCPSEFYASAPEQDLKAMARYLMKAG